MKMSEIWDVVVVGSCMIDLVCYTPRLPKSGETIRGKNFMREFGGKGCNQCVAARKLGANCLLVARIGDDLFGKDYYDKFLEYKIPRKFVKFTKGVASGMAQITVSETGENQIVVVPGANNHLTKKDVVEAAQAICNCSVLLCQMEVPETSTIEALRIKAESKRGKSIFNAAPATKNLDPLLFTLPDLFCVNESEAETIWGNPVANPSSAKEAVNYLLGKGCKEVLITLGSQGCVYGKQGVEDKMHIPALEVDAVDTTGAGDSFIGALAFLMATHPELPMQKLLQRASIAASISVQRTGTHSSYPTVDELPKEFAEL